MMQILIAKEKHGKRYFDASTLELLASASLTLLRERMEDGTYRKPDSFNESFTKEQQAYLKLTDEDIASFPELVREATQEKVTKLRQQAERLARWDKSEMKWFTAVEALLALPSEEAVKLNVIQGKGTQFERRYPKAFYYLQNRDGEEYEKVSLVEVEQA